jgi:hypothetical protein
MWVELEVPAYGLQDVSAWSERSHRGTPNDSPRITFSSSGLPVLDYRKATTNNKFMQFQSLLGPKVDTGGGWLINDVEYVTEVIMDDDVDKMEMALVGVIDDNPSVGEK